MAISRTAARWLAQAVETKAQQLLEENASAPLDDPALVVLRFYAAQSVPARFAFLEQLAAAIEQSPYLKISCRRL